MHSRPSGIWPSDPQPAPSSAPGAFTETGESRGTRAGQGTRPPRARLLIMGVLLASLSGLAQAPETSLTGELLDEMGGPIIAARASLQADDGHVYLARSTEKGIFRFPRIQQGTYTLDIDQSGLCAIHVSKIKVEAGEQKKLARMTMAAPGQSGECAGER